MTPLNDEIAHRLKHLQKHPAPSTAEARIALVRNVLQDLAIDVVSVRRLSHGRYLARWRDDEEQAEETPFAMMEPDWFGERTVVSMYAEDQVRSRDDVHNKEIEAALACVKAMRTLAALGELEVAPK